MLPKEPEDNPLDGTTIGYIRRIPDNMDPGHNGPHAKEQKRVAVKALKRPYKDPNPMVEKPVKSPTCPAKSGREERLPCY